MFRRNRHGDRSRQELLDLVRQYTRGLDRLQRGAVILAVQAMPLDKVKRILSIISQVRPLVEAGDIDGAEAVLRGLGLSDDDAIAQIREAMAHAGSVDDSSQV
jgi:hypothetical protein